MGFMQRFERSLENSTSDAFARVFGGALTPLEVEHALRRESGDKLQELPDGQLLSPNHFIVTLSPGDAQRFANDEATSPRVVSRHLDSYLYDQDWGVVGDVVVEFTESDDLRDGQYRLMSECNDKVVRVLLVQPAISPLTPPHLATMAAIIMVILATLTVLVAMVSVEAAAAHRIMRGSPIPPCSLIKNQGIRCVFLALVQRW